MDDNEVLVNVSYKDCNRVFRFRSGTWLKYEEVLTRELGSEIGAFIKGVDLKKTTIARNERSNNG